MTVIGPQERAAGGGNAATLLPAHGSASRDPRVRSGQPHVRLGRIGVEHAHGDFAQKRKVCGMCDVNIKARVYGLWSDVVGERRDSCFGR